MVLCSEEALKQNQNDASKSFGTQALGLLNKSAVKSTFVLSSEATSETAPLKNQDNIYFIESDDGAVNVSGRVQVRRWIKSIGI